jgi:hypothetical protein
MGCEIWEPGRKVMFVVGSKNSNRNGLGLEIQEPLEGDRFEISCEIL